MKRAKICLETRNISKNFITEEGKIINALAKTTIDICENDFICIEFSDNVGTIDQRTLSELKNELHAEKINQNYTGLININKRLKIAFGNESGVFIDNIPGGGVRTIIRIYASHGRKTG